MWGDSHAGSLWAAVAHTAGDTGLAAQLQWEPACPPLPGAELHLEGAMFPNCMRVNSTILNWLSSGELRGVTGVILEARWFVSQQMIPGTGETDLAATLGETVRRTIGRLNALGIRVLVFGPVPTLPFAAPECNYRTSLNGGIGRCNARRGNVDSELSGIVGALRSAVQDFNNARFVDLRNVLCDSDQCWSARNGQIYYTDDNHLSDSGAMLVLQNFKDDFAWVFAGALRDKPNVSQ